ncbi:somatostatin receptor type 3-like [Biomphalaria glabrata]|uniref:Somatostatin receptor type 3-like n=1 Tax=Biomphalaria glabrata TaxID=6526 RepID=A0A9W2YCF4_BIOGL|nr:somatostatin receptor type 3-like [Biomphalaria glabrata]XP_055860406.1 somatostatin receptor type 3-like [Biomphalaria glabrata]XP_055860407.1 somatostatin receptor type 3-like [Biomphalaria glabrata]XP_055860408.1 somatostatin receptor type 3-like [Biomphalaria glabrata]
MLNSTLFALKPNISLRLLVQLSFLGGGSYDDLTSKYNDSIETFNNQVNEVNRLWSMVLEIKQIYMWVLLAVGFPANILALVTVLTMHVVTPIALLIATLAVFDGTALIGKLIGVQISLRRLYLGSFGCKMEFLILFMSSMANWILALICLERYISLVHPTKRARWTSKKVVCAELIGTGTFLLSIFAAISLSMRDAIQSGYQCGVYTDYYWFYTHVWFWVNACLFLFIPCFIILPCTILTVVHIARTQRRYCDDKPASPYCDLEAPLTQRERQYQLNMTAMMVIAALFFIVLRLPSCIYYLSYQESADLVIEARWAVFEQIQFLLFDSTHAINFFIYFMSSRVFRHHLLYLLSCKKYKGTATFEEQSLEASPSLNECLTRDDSCSKRLSLELSR